MVGGLRRGVGFPQAHGAIVAAHFDGSPADLHLDGVIVELAVACSAGWLGHGSSLLDARKGRPCAGRPAVTFFRKATLFWRAPRQSARLAQRIARLTDFSVETL